MDGVRTSGRPSRDPPPILPTMRRWVCIVALLAGFSASDPSWSIRPRQPIPVERRLDSFSRAGGGLPAAAWWLFA